MTVAELIEKLKEFPPDMPVTFWQQSDESSGAMKIAEFNVHEMREVDCYSWEPVERPTYEDAPRVANILVLNYA
jgi:hypothetical protein